MIESTRENVFNHDHWQYYETIRCETPKELIDKLRLSNPEWSPMRKEVHDSEWKRNWIFRGQSDATWLLIPSAWRKSDKNILEIAKQSIITQAIVKAFIKDKEANVEEKE